MNYWLTVEEMGGEMLLRITDSGEVEKGPNFTPERAKEVFRSLVPIHALNPDIEIQQCVLVLARETNP